MDEELVQDPTQFLKGGVAGVRKEMEEGDLEYMAPEFSRSGS